MNIATQPTADAAEVARSALRALRPLASRASETQTVTLRSKHDGDEVVITLPSEAFKVLVDVLSQMANGSAVTVVPLHAELTTQQAADFLNVSRPFLVGLLEQGNIPFRKVGTHRRVRMADLVAYRKRDDAERRAVVDELAADARDQNLGY